MPNEAEAHGLVALMEIQASRDARAHQREGRADFAARSGSFALGSPSDSSRLGELDRAEAIGGSLGPYALQAAIAACHARANSGDQTDWARIAALYDALAQLTPSPIVELNRAVAISMAFGPAAGLELIDQVVAERRVEELSFAAQRARRFSLQAGSIR